VWIMKIQNLIMSLDPILRASISMAGALLGITVVIVLLYKQKKRVNLYPYKENAWLILKKRSRLLGVVFL
jgi:hypothetical protein